MCDLKVTLAQRYPEWVGAGRIREIFRHTAMLPSLSHVFDRCGFRQDAS